MKESCDRCHKEFGMLRRKKDCFFCHAKLCGECVAKCSICGYYFCMRCYLPHLKQHGLSVDTPEEKPQKRDIDEELDEALRGYRAECEANKKELMKLNDKEALRFLILLLYETNHTGLSTDDMKKMIEECKEE